MSDTPTVAFEKVGDRLIARLGSVAVGEVMHFPRGWAWRVSLSDTPAVWRYAASCSDACAQLSDRVLQWVDAAGLASSRPPADIIRVYRPPAVRS